MKRKPAKSLVWVVYDGRAHGMDTDDCAVLQTCESEAEARAVVADWGEENAVAFVYDLDESTVPASATNERRAW
jgi:hypothetical protein